MTLWDLAFRITNHWYWVVPFILASLGVILTMIRHRQEETQREIYSLRRVAHTVS